MLATEILSHPTLDIRNQPQPLETPLIMLLVPTSIALLSIAGDITFHIQRYTYKCKMFVLMIAPSPLE